MAEQSRVALVTGGAKRVGQAIARELARAGFDIAFTYHSSEAQAGRFVEELRAMKRNTIAIYADLTDPERYIETIYEHVSADLGRLDVLVNNASLFLPARLAETTVETMRKVMAIHFEAPLLLAKRFAADLRAARGHIVSMSDLLAERPWPEYLAYCASKAALSNLTRGLARELAPEVTVNAIAPGVVEWPERYPEEEKERYLKRVLLARPGTPEDVARLVRFLVTEGAYITGQIIPLDGGRSIT